MGCGDRETSVLAAVEAEWRRLAAIAEGAPRRQDFDPLRTPQAMPHMVLTEVLRGADGALADFRFRLIGDYVDRQARLTLRGARLSELPGKGPGSEIWRAYETAVESRRPYWVSLPYVGEQADARRTQEVFLPFRGETGDAIAFVLAVVTIG